MATRVAREENDFAARERAGEQFIRWRAKRRLDLDPFLIGEAFDVVKPAAADDADFVSRHGECLTTKDMKDTKKHPEKLQCSITNYVAHRSLTVDAWNFSGAWML